MVQQILKTKGGKWALALVIVAALAVIGSLSEGSTEAIPGALILILIAAGIVISAVKKIQNPPAAPSLSIQGVHVSQEAIDAFNTYGTIPNVDNTPIILADGEQAVHACRAERIETKNRRLGTTGGGAGASIRIAKGVSVRTGGTGSQSIYGDVEMVHAGEFVATTRRIVFVANSRAFEESLSDISAISVDGGSLVVMTRKDSYTLRMPMAEYACEIIKRCIKSM